MKRLFAAALSLCLAATAFAGQYDVMLIRGTMGTPANTDQQECQRVIDQNFQSLQDILNRAGCRYSVYKTREASPNSFALESYIQTGIFARWNGLLDTASCVIYPSYQPGTTYGSRCDSLFRLTKGGCSVPTCWLLDNSLEVNQGLSGLAYLDDAPVAANRDSVGCSGSKTNPSPGGAPVSVDGSKRMWINNEYVSGYTRNASQSPAGGLRPLLYSSSTGEGIVLPFMQQNSTWPDSLPFLTSQAADTLLVWDRLWNVASLPTAKPMTFVSWAGAGLNSLDSLSAANATPRPVAEGCLDVLMFGLAHFDSLTGGKIFGRMTKPYQIALTVDGALTRNSRRRIPGILDADTSVFYSTLDSIAALNVPITFGVAVDSGGSYLRDVIKLKSISQAHFTPQSWKGLQRGASGDTTNGAGSGAAGKNNLVDPFGRYRVRTFVGDFSGVGADSSLSSLLYFGRLRCDSLFGSGRGSKALLAPYDDYSPKNMTPGPGCPPSDSLVYAFTRAGFEAVRSNNRWSNSFPGRGTEGRTNPRGWFTRQAVIRDNYGSGTFKVVCDGGYPLLGGYRQGKQFDDSTSVPPAQIGHVEFFRVTGELLGQRRFDFDPWGNPGTGQVASWYSWRDINQHTEDFQAPELASVSSSSYISGPGNVMMLHCSDLSGSASGPARVGWWHMRHIVSWAQLCNQAAARSIFTFVYPEEIAP